MTEHSSLPKTHSVPMISGAMVRSLVDVEAALRIIEQTYADYGRERQVLSAPPALLLPNRAPEQAAFKVKGARIASLGVAGFRMIADRETEAGEETIDYCWLADAATGRLLGLVDETWLHRLRTATTGVIAAKWLARRHSRTAAIIGAGKIADEIPAGLARVFDLQEIRVASRRIETVRAFAERHGGAVPVRACSSVAEAAEGADIIITLTSSKTPVLRAADITPGAFVCGMGGGGELAADLLHRADRFIVDDLEYACTIGTVRGWIESGVARETIAKRVAADIGEVVTGAKPGRTSDNETVVSVIQGMACCDVALSHLVLQRSGGAA